MKAKEKKRNTRKDIRGIVIKFKRSYLMLVLSSKNAIFIV